MKSSEFSIDDEQIVDATCERIFDALDQLRRVLCPRCKVRGSFGIAEDMRHLRVWCRTPIPLDVEDGRIHCGYEVVIYVTSTGDLPHPRFTATEPAPSGPRRRRTTP